jgi:hypothetical protein
VKGSEFVQQVNHIPPVRRASASILVGGDHVAGVGMPSMS